MEPYQERVIAERDEVAAFANATQDRLIKLVDFTATPAFASLPLEQQQLLQAQAVTMRDTAEQAEAYKNILDSRISTF